MIWFGLGLAAGSLAFGALVYIAGAWADEPHEGLVISGLLSAAVGFIAGLTLTIAGAFV
jgi:hypothetical protein